MLLYHCKANTGYAIETLEQVFWRVAKRLVASTEHIHLCYKSYSSGHPTYTPENFDNFYELKSTEKNSKKLAEFQSYIEKHGINLILGFDQAPKLPYYRYARKAGVHRIISYYGAPMSSLNSGIRLALKRLQVSLYRNTPDLFIFESKAMQMTAYHGRGVPEEKTAVCYLGVDIEKFKPSAKDASYAHHLLGIDPSQKLIFYSGHFEPRKGVSIIVNAANAISEERDDITFVLFGNQPGEEKQYQQQLTEAGQKHTVFGGYRKDLNRIHRSCYAGVIASTGWDSFTVSSIEMQASGLPLLVSNLNGLNETILPGETGDIFEAGRSDILKTQIIQLVDNADARNRMSEKARIRVERDFSIEGQEARLADLLRGL